MTQNAEYVAWRPSTQEFVHVNGNGIVDGACGAEVGPGEAILWMCRVAGMKWCPAVLTLEEAARISPNGSSETP